MSDIKRNEKLNKIFHRDERFTGVHFCPIVGQEGDYPIIKFLKEKYVLTASGIVKFVEWHIADFTDDPWLINYQRKINEIPLYCYAKEVMKRNDLLIIVF